MMFYEYFEELAEEEMKELLEQNITQRIAGDKLFHPIYEFLKGKSVYTLRDNESVTRAIDLMKEKEIGAVLITDHHDKVIGIFTERDVLEKIVGQKDRENGLLFEVMTKNPMSLTPDLSLFCALTSMIAGGYRHVPIISQLGTPLGILSVRDISAVILSEFEKIYRERIQSRRDLA